jgi:predicted ATPase/class 3 adenylate cyclase
MPTPPTGTVTFLFTDIEGSTRRWEAYPQQMRHALQRHDSILRSAIEEQGGYIFKTIGDAFCAAFAAPTDAIHATLIAQHALYSEQWPQELGQIKVRMALHTGEVYSQEGDYFGPPVNRVARLLSAGYGGQTLISEVTYGLSRDALPAGVAVKDLGEHRLKDLARPEHIFEIVSPGLPSEFPPLKTLGNHSNNLPVQPNPLIGREKEMAHIVGLLGRRDVRLVTLTGPGGSGKTRLSLHVGADLLDGFPDGVWLVELAALREPALVVPTIAAVLGLKEAGGTPILDTLKEHLRDKKLLLVLDNFEQVVGAALHVGQLLSNSPDLKVLVTSRAPLRINGEKEYPVAPLALPPDSRQGHLPPLERLTQYEAVRLFIDRATDIKPDFQVTNDNAPAVAQICVRLDGLPLAIELAAARIRLLSPQAMLSRLQNRLKLLTGGGRDRTARQQTLRGAIDWSYDLLVEGEKQLFRRMAAFNGGRTLEALVAVCNFDGHLHIDVLEGVEALLSNNLLQQREGSDGEPRFWMLETLHEYAREKLEESGEASELHREHALYFTRLAEEAEQHLKGKQQADWLNRLEDEHDNIRAALRWAKETGESGNAENIELGLRIGGAIWLFWQVRGYLNEGRSQLSELLERAANEASQTGPQALHTPAPPTMPQENSARAERLAAYRAKALNAAGNLAWGQGDLTTARSLHEASLCIRQEIGDKRGIANSLNNLGIVTYWQGDFTTSRSLQEASLSIKREIGDMRGIGSSLVNLATVAKAQGDYAAARSRGEESLMIHREFGNSRTVAISLELLGSLALDQGDYVSAHALYKESLALRQEIGDKRGIGISLAGLAALAVARTQDQDEEGTGSTGRTASTAHVEAQRGTRLLGAVESLLEAIGAVLESHDRLVHEQSMASASALLGHAEFERLLQEGRAMSMEQAIEYALGEGRNA